MPLDYAVGILDYRLIWNDAVAPAAAAAVESEAVAAAATVVAAAAAAEEVGQDAAPSCFSELDEEAPSVAAPAQTQAQTQAQAHQDACLLHPEFRKMEIGISAIANKALEPSLAFLKSAIAKLKKVADLEGAGRGTEKGVVGR